VWDAVEDLVGDPPLAAEFVADFVHETDGGWHYVFINFHNWDRGFMADDQDEVCKSRYYYSANGEPAAPDETPADCPACRGTGKVMLLVSTRPCEACGGTGKFAVAAGAEAEGPPQAGSDAEALEADEDYEVVVERIVEHRVPRCWVTTSTYDSENRLRSQVGEFVAGGAAAGGGDAKPTVEPSP
jgi:hypothetical protein